MAIDKGKKDGGSNKGGGFSDRLGDAPNNPNPAGQGNANDQPGIGPQRQASQQGNQPFPPNNMQGEKGVMNINRSMARPMARHSSGIPVMRYKDALTKMMNEEFESHDLNNFQLHVLDNNGANIGPFSALLLTRMVQHGAEYHAAVYIMVVDASSDPLPPKVRNFNNKETASVDVVAGDILGPNYWNACVEKLNSVVGAKVNYVPAGGYVIPRELDPEDEQHMRNVLFYAQTCCVTVSENIVGAQQEPLFTVGMIDNEREQMTVRSSYASNNDHRAGQSETAAGLPLRSDIRIELDAYVRTQDNDNPLQVNSQRGLTTVDCYIEPVYSPQQPNPQQPGPVPHYYAQGVITRLDTQTSAITLEQQIFGMSTISVLNRNLAWAGAFLPRHDVPADKDTHDIGALGYEYDFMGDPNAVPDKVDTRTQFSVNDFYHMIRTAFRPNMAFAMDIPEADELAWINDAFRASAAGNQEATQHVLNAANQLTHGQFGKYFQQCQDQRIMADTGNRIHLGYYKAEGGVLRDIRELDYLAILNLLGRDSKDVLEQWARTFEATDVPIDYRLDKRAAIIRRILGANTVHITGYAQRYNINPAFIDCVNAGCADNGVTFRPSNLQTDMGGQSARGDFNIGNFAFGNNNIGTGVYFTGGNQWGNNGNGFGSQFGRYGW